MLLTRAQEVLLDQISEARQREQAAIKVVEDQFREQIRVLKEGKGYEDTHRLMREAHEAGIPKRQIGLAYGTKDPHTVNRILGTSTPATTHAAHTPTLTPAENSVFVEEMSYSDPDFPHFLGENHPVSKIQVACLQVTPTSKIGRVSAVVDLKAKICVESDSTELTRLIDGPRYEYPQALEDALGPLLDRAGARPLSRPCCATTVVPTNPHNARR